MESIFPEHQERIHQIMSVLNDTEKEMVIDTLKKLGKSISN